MDTQKEIMTFLTQNKNELMAQFHLSKIGLFGSFAKETQTPISDVDILIELDSDTSNTYALKNALRIYLTGAFGRSVDIAREKYLKPYAKKTILENVLYV